VYALLAFTVVRHMREIGVRIALGATRSSVLRTVVRNAMLLASAGLAIGVPCTVAAGRFSRALLDNLTPNHPATLMAASGGFLVLAAPAALLPALRASAIEPAQALRHD
jgi:ABC-type antimicrobial peptide transport system permease subunit